LAVILAKGVALFKGYKDPDSPSTWGEILKKYDPKNQLDGLDTQIAELENFGIDSAKAKRTKASTKATKRASPKKVRGRAASAKKTSVAKKSLITTRASPVQSAWKRIDSWLNHNAPARAKSLARGVTVTQITAIESQIGRPLPEEFKESYSEHDGQKDDLPVIPDPCGPLHFLRVKAIIREWKYCAYMADSGEFEDVSIKADKGVARDWWNPGWIPFATNGCGDYLCIDLAPTKIGASGQVIRMQEDEPERSLLASSFRTWLEQLADALEHGELEILY
jgi:cell wall assembly regulator SMI1